MPRDGIADAAVLAEDIHIARLIESHLGLGIVVLVDDVAYAEMVAAAGSVDQAVGIHRLGPVGDLDRARLAPGLVVRHPYHDGRVIPELVDDFAPVGIVLVHRLAAAHLRVSFQELPLAAPVGAATVAAGHILPYQHTELVAPVVPAVGLHLHVLADGVETEILGALYVKLQSLVVRGGVETVGPPALVEGTHHKDILVVELSPQDAVFVHC